MGREPAPDDISRALEIYIRSMLIVGAVLGFVGFGLAIE